MKITSLEIQNFRTIESLRLDFHPTYTAMCGPNDSGKTNVVRALRALLKETGDDDPFAFPDSAEIAYKDDYPKWKDTVSGAEPLTVSAELEIDQNRDAGLFQSVTKQLSIESPPALLKLHVSSSYSPSPDKTIRKIVVRAKEKEFSGLDAQEVLNRIQSARCLIVHNSTQAAPRFFFRGGSVAGILKDLSAENQQLLAKILPRFERSSSKVGIE
jgi:predicted ATPase